MRKYTKCNIAAVLLLAVIAFSSCKDISGENIIANTVPTMAEDESVLFPEKDEQTMTGGTVDAAVGFTTTGDAEDDTFDPFLGTAQSEETGFPVQTGTSPAPAETTQPPETATTAASTTTVAATTTTTAPLSNEAPAPAAQTPDGTGYNVIGENGILVSYQNGHYRGIMACFGTYGLCERWATALNMFAEKLPAAKVYSLTVPIASEFYTPQSFWDSGFTVSQFNKSEHIRENLSGAIYVDGYTALAAHTDEDIYSRTDHHWQPLGAYYAAQEFAKSAGVDFPTLDKYTPVSLGGYVGSMYTYSKDYHLYNDPETFTMYLPPNVDTISTTYYNTYFSGGYASDLFIARNASAFYCSFLGSDDRIAKIETDVKNGRTLVVFKMSYGNALIPFLTSSFENIYVCDMRYFELNAITFCNDVGATDVLCTDCVMTAAGNGCKYLEYVLSR